jgi:hypothetical protein
VVAIATGDRAEAVERFRKETGTTYPVLLDDGRAAASFGVDSSPTCILVRADGSIAYRGPHVPENFP